jgi:methylated-DNA-protein-cysteine methyltransferase-like protein
MTDYYHKVYAIVRKIPKGKVSTYGDIAEYLGTKGSARLVGYAMNNAHSVSPFVPAHRVVNRNGLLTGKHHFSSTTLMQELLESEGIKIINDQIQDFKEVKWNLKRKKEKETK